MVRPKVDLTPHREAIKSMLLAGQSCGEISRWLLEAHGVHASRSTVQVKITEFGFRESDVARRRRKCIDHTDPRPRALIEQGWKAGAHSDDELVAYLREHGYDWGKRGLVEYRKNHMGWYKREPGASAAAKKVRPVKIGPDASESAVQPGVYAQASLPVVAA